MPDRLLRAGALILCLALLGPGAPHSAAAQSPPAGATSSVGGPYFFVENVGQFAEGARFHR